MKRFFALLLTLLLTLSACGGDAAAEDPLPPSPVEPSESLPSPEEEQPPIDAEEQWLLDRLAAMTVEEKVGQLFFVRCPESGAAEDVASYHLGGLLLFGRDFKDKSAQEITETIAAYQSAAALPLFIGVDEEGGTVCRVSSQPQLRQKRFSSPQALYRAGGIDAVLAEDSERNTLLRSLGINVNFAPVADISTNASDFIYARSLGQDAETTAEVISALVRNMAAQEMGSVLKHFPGYGNNVDTHTGIAVDERPLASFWESDLLPFRAGIEAGSPFVLVSHNIVTAMDAERPASLSAAVHTLLREELGFCGIILTDDLAMDAVQSYADDGSVAVLAALAGNDMIITSDYQTQIPQLIAAVEEGTLSHTALDAAVERILRGKISLGLIDINENEV